jgi:hypothetical protein
LPERIKNKINKKLKPQQTLQTKKIKSKNLINRQKCPSTKLRPKKDRNSIIPVLPTPFGNL